MGIQKFFNSWRFTKIREFFKCFNVGLTIFKNQETMLRVAASFYGRGI